MPEILRTIASIVLFVICILTIPFALISGSEAFGTGISAIIKNSPNAIPWIILLLIAFLARRNGKVGGTLLLIGGGFMVYLFNTGPRLDPVVLVLTMLIPLTGVAFLIHWHKTRLNSDSSE